MQIAEATRGRYLVWEDGAPSGGEAFELFREEGGARAKAERRTADGKLLYSAEARFDGAWRLVSLQLSAGGKTGSYGWDGDAWVGRVRGRAEQALPMVGELDALCPGALFDLIFIARVALPPLSQRRVELLRVSPETLETEEGHVIVERLPDAELEWDGSARVVQHYRATDEHGRQDLLWVGDGGVCLKRVCVDGARPRYALAL